MRLFHWGKDGGDASTVWGFFLIEVKSLFSIVLLCFEDGSREAYHTHAFNCFSWVLSGWLAEYLLKDPRIHRNPVPKQGGLVTHRPSWRPFVTRRATFHMVVSRDRTWVLTFRGPWADTWEEYLPNEAPGERYVTLTHGREEVTP